MNKQNFRKKLHKSETEVISRRRAFTLLALKTIGINIKKNKKLTSKSKLQTYQILTNDDQMFILRHGLLKINIFYFFFRLKMNLSQNVSQ